MRRFAPEFFLLLGLALLPAQAPLPSTVTASPSVLMVSVERQMVEHCAIDQPMTAALQAQCADWFEQYEALSAQVLEDAVWMSQSARVELPLAPLSRLDPAHQLPVASLTERAAAGFVDGFSWMGGSLCCLGSMLVFLGLSWRLLLLLGRDAVRGLIWPFALDEHLIRVGAQQKLRALRGLLGKLFSATELRAFVGDVAPDLVRWLPGLIAPQAMLTAHAALLLMAAGRVNRAFFEQLLLARPNCGADIQPVAELWPA